MPEATAQRSPQEPAPVRGALRPQFRIEAIAPDALDRIRVDGEDDFGNPILVTIDEEGGAPLRCCLQPAEPGAAVALIAHRPFARPGPYAEVGPVFIHAGRCAGYDTPEQYPPGFRDWPTLIFRPYHFDGRMAYPALAMVEGRHAEQAIAEMFADPTIEVIHSRNLYAGCFMFGIHRSHRDPLS
ncbi:MAG: DUF1203 domain-containing protein [Acidimicrobiales bacterium]